MTSISQKIGQLLNSIIDNGTMDMDVEYETPNPEAKDGNSNPHAGPSTSTSNDQRQKNTPHQNREEQTNQNGAAKNAEFVAGLLNDFLPKNTEQNPDEPEFSS